MHITIFCFCWFILTGAQFLHVPEGEDVEADEDPLAREQDLNDCHHHMLPPTWGCPTLFPRAGTISAWGGDIIIIIYLLYIYISTYLIIYINISILKAARSAAAITMELRRLVRGWAGSQ